LIEEGSDTTAFSVVVPDFPGCFSAGDTLDEALDAAREAASAWLDAALDSDTPVPAPSTLDQVRRLADYKGWAVGVIDLEGDLFDDTIERLNITLPARDIDDHANTCIFSQCLNHLSHCVFLVTPTMC